VDAENVVPREALQKKERIAPISIAETIQPIPARSFAKTIKQARPLKRKSLPIGLHAEMEPNMAIHQSQQKNLFNEANQAWDAGEKKRAYQLFLAAARQGEDDAFNSVGYFLDHGIGVKKDSASAYTWYRRAAMRGNLAGCLNLGVWFRDAGNLRRSKFWFEKAYEQGDGSAAYELGKIYLSQPSSASAARAFNYLNAAVKSKYINMDEREEARKLLVQMKRK
jgi:TPR repeat protein